MGPRIDDTDAEPLLPELHDGERGVVDADPTPVRRVEPLEAEGVLEQDADGAAVGHHGHVRPRHLLERPGHPRPEGAEGLAARRSGIRVVESREDARVPRLRLVGAKALEHAQVPLHERGQELHHPVGEEEAGRLVGAGKGTRVHMGHREDLKMAPEGERLTPSDLREGNVKLALEHPRSVPFGLAMPDQVEDLHLDLGGGILDVRTLDTWQKLAPGEASDHAVVVFDVLRATTALAAALAGGASWVAVLPSVGAAEALRRSDPDLLLAGEVALDPPPGFDLGNSPVQYTRAHLAGRRLAMVTTNGTRALDRAKDALALFAGALVNAEAVARALLPYPAVLLVAAGTDGRPSLEDLLGAGAVLSALDRHGAALRADPLSALALELYRAFAPSLAAALAATRNGQRLVARGFAADVAWAARRDACPVTPVVVARDPLRFGLLP